MTEAAPQVRESAHDVGGMRAFMDKIERDQRAARGAELIRDITDERPALTMLGLLTIVAVLSVGAGWLVVRLHLG